MTMTYETLRDEYTKRLAADMLAHPDQFYLDADRRGFSWEENAAWTVAKMLPTIIRSAKAGNRADYVSGSRALSGTMRHFGYKSVPAFREALAKLDLPA